MYFAPYDLPKDIIEVIKQQTRDLARELEVRGLMNVQYAVKDGKVYLLEVNPRASRTIPFVSKAVGVPLAKLAAFVMVGRNLADMGLVKDPEPSYTSAKEVVLPFIKFPGVDIILGPEMRSTGEVMGIDKNMGLAYAKSQIAAGNSIPLEGTIFISLNDHDKKHIGSVARDLYELGFKFIATKGTASVLRAQGIDVAEVFKLGEGRPNVLDCIINGYINWIINTPKGKSSKDDEVLIRRKALENNIPTMTTLAAAKAAVQALREMKKGSMEILSLQKYHRTTGIQVKIK